MVFVTPFSIALFLSAMGYNRKTQIIRRAVNSEKVPNYISCYKLLQFSVRNWARIFVALYMREKLNKGVLNDKTN